MDDEIKKYGKAQLEGILDGEDDDDVEYKLDNPFDEDLHNSMYNEDYFIIGYGKAEDFMGADAFDVIGAVQQYEEDNFGEAQTDLSSSEKVANMYAYIRGEELMDDIIKDYKRDRINDRKKSDRNNTNKKFDSGNDFKFRQ
jgi:hypothetical protein